MASQHAHPAKAFHPPTDLYERYKKATEQSGDTMIAGFIAYMRYYLHDTSERPPRARKKKEHHGTG